MALRTALIMVLLILFVPPRAFSQGPAVSPDWTAADYRGTQVNLTALAGERPTVLFFWATWCPYCKALMPHLQSIRHEYGDRVNIVALTIRDDDGDPVSYIEDGGFEFTTILEADEIAAANDVYGTPGVLILNPDREVEFNLYRLPKVEPPETAEPARHGRRAAYKAPFWAAEIRQAIDRVQAAHYAD